MSEIYDGVDDIVKTNQHYQELDVRKKDDDITTSTDYQELNVRKVDPLDHKVMAIKGNPGLNARERDDDVIREEDYEELDIEKVDEATQYASLK